MRTSVYNFINASCILSPAYPPGIHHPNNVYNEVSTVKIEAEIEGEAAVIGKL